MKKALLAAAVAIAAMYVGGVVCLFLGNIGAGASLWILSTVIGLGILWHVDRRRKRSSAASEDTGADAEGPQGPSDNNGDQR